MADSISNFSTTFDPQSSIPVFGSKSPNLGTYPNDVVVLDIYNYTNDYLETLYRATRIQRNNLDIKIDVEGELHNLRYYSGKYNVTARFLRNYLGSGDGDKLIIQEVSSDRMEVRVTPLTILQNVNSNFEDFFTYGLFEVDKREVLTNLYLFVDNDTSFKVFDYVQDPFTFPNAPFSIIFKLSSPLPNNIQLDDLVWMAQEVSQPIKDAVTVLPPKRQLGVTTIAGPNFDIATSNTTNTVSDYKSWNDVLSTNTNTSLQIINKLFSGSFIEGIDLNIDFKDFSNFIHFGSAEERLKNFQYKLQLVEYYDSRLYTLSQSYATSFVVSSSLTGSTEFVANILDTERKRSTLIGTFDSYEKYLYFESSSYVTNSFGEFVSSTWPKSNSTKPYVNYSTTSSEATTWFNGMLISASQYDLNNQSGLRKIIPQHIYVNDNNDQYILFVDMIGHYFDLIYMYVKQLTYINKRYESLTEGFAKDLVYAVGQSFGLNVENGATLENLWSYLLGTNVTGSLISPTYGYSVEDRTKEVWKRIVANLPYLLKTKGTARGIRALINCYGIPSTILRVREFGGPEPTFYSATQEEYDQFYYGLQLTGSNQITIPIAQYSDSDGSSGVYGALEVRFRLDTSILETSANYHLMSGPIDIKVNPGTSTLTIGGTTINAPFSASDTDWWTILANDGGKAYVGANRYGKALIYTSSANVSISETQALIPGGTAPKFYGLVNEFRLWRDTLDLEVFENHVLAPTSFQGPQDDFTVGSTSSFATLKVRHTFGADGKKYTITSGMLVTSSHPDQSSKAYTSGNRTATFSGFSGATSSYWIPQVETHYLEVVDGGPTRKVGNKIRIETGIISSSNQLQLGSSVLESLQDLQPVDSPRLGVYFSPTDEVDEDINEQFGGINLDDYIGDPANYYRDEYVGLDQLKNSYFRKYQKRNDVQGFIRLVQNYDTSLFQLVKQFAPERALLHTGVVVESHALHRTKVGQKQPSHEELHWSSSIDPEPYTAGDTLPLIGTVNSFDDILSGDINDLSGSTDPVVDTAIVAFDDMNPAIGQTSVATAYTTAGAMIEYNTDEVAELMGDAQSRTYNASQYSYYNWFQTGSGAQDWVYAEGVSQDIWDPVQPVVLNNARSSVYTTATDRFNKDFTQNSLFLSQLIDITGSALSASLRQYGVTHSISTFSSAQTPTYDIESVSGSYVFKVTYSL